MYSLDCSYFKEEFNSLEEIASRFSIDVNLLKIIK
jgi:hypothetical protein